MIVGGDTHYNDGKVISDQSVSLKECDIKDYGYSVDARGTHRFVYYSNAKNVRVFETVDHYQTFNEITIFDIMPYCIISLILFSIYVFVVLCFIVYLYLPNIIIIIKRRLNL